MSADAIATIWAVLIATAVFLYVCMDGFDLGVGILFPWIRGREDRDTSVNTVAPVWDGNETWLIMGGGGLFAVFPLAYAVIMPAVYMPIIVMLLALIFRAVSIEYRGKVRSDRARALTDLGLGLGSFVAAFGIGAMLGLTTTGLPIDGNGDRVGGHRPLRISVTLLQRLVAVAVAA